MNYEILFPEGVAAFKQGDIVSGPELGTEGGVAYLLRIGAVKVTSEETCIAATLKTQDIIDAATADLVADNEMLKATVESHEKELKAAREKLDILGKENAALKVSETKLTEELKKAKAPATKSGTDKPANG